MSKRSLEIKRKIYVFSFSVLGLLMSLVIYGLASLIIISKHYEVNLNVYLWIMVAGGVVAGYFEGLRWWHIIYVDKAHLKWPKHKHETKLLGLMVLIVLTIAILFLARNY